MEIAEHIEVIRREGELFARAAECGGLDVKIPTCPRWKMRDLVRHQGGVHRWAALHVREARRDVVNGFEEAMPEGWPADDELLSWFRAGHAELVRVLETADPSVQCFTWLKAPSPLAFWARRQAHETAIHRADAESPTGDISGYAADVAKDGLDELLLGFFTRSGRLVAERECSIHVHTIDTAGEWLVRLGPTGTQVSEEHGDADCTVSGRASDLYLLMWNRLRASAVDVTGDRSVLELWRKKARVRWG